MKSSKHSKPAPDQAWSASPPDSEGLWWLYGEEEFGAMGGNFSGTVPPRIELHVVKVSRIGTGERSSLVGVTGGRFIQLRQFDLEKCQSGYLGVWLKAELPDITNAVKNTKALVEGLNYVSKK